MSAPGGNDTSEPSPAAAPAPAHPEDGGEPAILSHLRLLDPILQFLTRATGQSLISLAILRRTLPKDGGTAATKVHNAIRSIPELGRRGILRVAVRRGPVEGGNSSGQGNAEEESTEDMNHNNCIFEEDEVYRRYDAALNFSGGGQQQVNSTNEQDQDLLLVGFFPKPGHFNGEFIAAEAAAASSAHSAHAKASADGKGLHGATKTGAKKRLAALLKSLKADLKGRQQADRANENAKAKSKTELATKKRQRKNDSARRNCDESIKESNSDESNSAKDKNGFGETGNLATDASNSNNTSNTSNSNDSTEAREALDCFRTLMGIKTVYVDENPKGSEAQEENNDGPEPLMLPGQTAFAGCKPSREVRYGTLSREARRLIPSALAEAFGLDIETGTDQGDPVESGSEQNPVQGRTKHRRRLYRHQATAVESILGGHHTTICTGTGSGKSLCFLLPILSIVMKADIDAVTAAAFSSGNSEESGVAAIIMFPTKALAQDQYTKLMGLINSHPLLLDHIRVGVIDGDVPHSSRADICKASNIILTNPDTIHAAILPNWKRTYASFLARVRYVVIDESHMYEGGEYEPLLLAETIAVGMRLDSDISFVLCAKIQRSAPMCHLFLPGSFVFVQRHSISVATIQPRNRNR